jgi:hypothetical protein
MNLGFAISAHVFVGILFGAAIMATCRDREAESTTYGYADWLIGFLMNLKWWILAIGLTVLEVVAFFIRRTS